MGDLGFTICRKSVDEVSLVGIEAFRHRIGSDRNPRSICRNSMDGLSMVGMNSIDSLSIVGRKSIDGLSIVGMSLYGFYGLYGLYGFYGLRDSTDSGTQGSGEKYFRRWDGDGIGEFSIIGRWEI